MLNLKEAATKQIAYTSSGAIGTGHVETWTAGDRTQDASISSGIVFNARQPPNSMASLIGLDEFGAPLDDLNDSDAAWTALGTSHMHADDSRTYEPPSRTRRTDS